MAADDPRQSRAEDAPEVEQIRRSLARGGRPRVGRRFDAIMQNAKATRARSGSPPGSQEPAKRALRQDGLARWSSADDEADVGSGEPPTPAAESDDSAPRIVGPIIPDPPEAQISEAQIPDAETPEERVQARAEAIAPEPDPAWVVPDASPRWETTTEAPLEPATSEDEVPVVEMTGDPILRDDELAALSAVPQRRAQVGGARDGVLGVVRRPPTGMLLLVTVIVLATFGLGIIVGDKLRATPAGAPSAAPGRVASAPTEPAASTQATAAATVPATQPPAISPALPPQACLDTARFGDRVISLLTANTRDRRLDEALRRYATASQQCRQAASQRR